MTALQLLAAAIGVGSVAAWLGLYGLALLATRPARPQPGPATQDLPGSEPPAVVSLLSNHWELTEDAAESTLIDLAARHIIEFRQPANDPMQTTIHLRQTGPAGLNPYEQRIFNRVAGLAVGGVVPLPALTFRDKGQAAAFEKRLRAEVVADARARGLSRRRFGPTILGALSVAAIAAGSGVAVAVLMLATHVSGQHTRDIGGALKGAGFGWLISTAVLSGIAHRSIGERHTARGVEVATRWLGVKQWLRNTTSFADLPPSAVVVWDRYLSYGDALGTTHVCSAVIDLGMGNRRRVWSSWGNTWHQVRISYPRFWPRYGKTAGRLVFRGILAGVIGFALLYFWVKAVARVVADPAVSHGLKAGLSDTIQNVGLLIGITTLTYGLYVLLRTAIDVASPTTITGQVLWRELWRTRSGGEDRPPVPVLHHLAIDDGSSDRTRAWGMPHAFDGTCSDGDTVTIKVRRWSRRIVELTVVERGNSATVGVVPTTDNTESLISAAMGLPRSGPVGLPGLVPSLAPQGVRIGELLTVDEVSRALGFPASPPSSVQAGAPVPMSVFQGPDGNPALTMIVSTGITGRMAMRARKRSQPLAGIGDEAYTGDGWAVGRRGDTVVVLRLQGTGQRADPRNVYWLLSVAVGRLPAPVG
jgi:hypothetical protein